MGVASTDGNGGQPTLLSLFAGCGGLDLGFEDAGYSIGLAYDRNQAAIASWNRNRKGPDRGHVFDLATIRFEHMDRHFGGKFVPQGVIGGPPCQGFSRANRARHRGDARTCFYGSCSPLRCASIATGRRWTSSSWRTSRNWGTSTIVR